MESKWNGKGKFLFKKHSLVMLRWQTRMKISDISSRSGEIMGNRENLVVSEAEAARPV
jgi:hypothetical protein